MRRKIIASTMIITTLIQAVTPVYASTNHFDYRKKVIGIAGIMTNTTTNLSDSVSRGDFAKYLVNASTYKDYATATSTVSVYSDVPYYHANAAAIRLAADKQWMSGYLGGLFKPEQPITLKEAVKGILALLGYSNSDFTGNTSDSRMSLYYSLKLNDEINRLDNEILTKTDCINLFYNLLTTKIKDSEKVYATTIGCEVNSDGEINPLELADTTLTGPKLVRKNHALGDYVPFNVKEANIFINGDASSYETLKTYIQSNYVVIYYNQQAKTIWAYVADADVQSGVCAVRGTIENIYYSSADVMTPSSITLSDDSNTYQLNSSEVQFAFSIYGSLRVGDTVTLICQKTTNSNDEATYVITDYVED